ncbi:MAG TPA: lamin tail domain-containing protein, partial [Verrucomicrobiae bacterium]|nr:lamin tail domain-containing protein [Verrucomicrobiae bacterium]
APHFHANFRIDPFAGSLALVSTRNNRTSVVDYLNYRLAVADQSYGSYPDGDSHSRAWFLYPTPGLTNNPISPPPPIRINEWMASNTSALYDQTYAAYSDWFELFNPSENQVDLAGWRLSDSPGNPREFFIPSGVVIAPRGYLLVWADDHGTFTNGYLHTNFKIDRGGDDVALFDATGLLIDTVSFAAQANNISQGRWPDGIDSFHSMPTPTPSRANVIAHPPEVEIIAITADAARNIKITWTATPGRLYRIETKSDLVDPSWTDQTGSIIANTDTLTWTGGLAPQPTQRFYRVTADDGHARPD